MRFIFKILVGTEEAFSEQEQLSAMHTTYPRGYCICLVSEWLQIKRLTLVELLWKGKAQKQNLGWAVSLETVTLWFQWEWCPSFHGSGLFTISQNHLSASLQGGLQYSEQNFSSPKTQDYFIEDVCIALFEMLFGKYIVLSLLIKT